MKSFLTTLTLFISIFATLTQGLARSDLIYVSAVFKDLRANVEQYAEHHRDYPEALMVPEIFRLLVDAQYHTDDSFTSLIHPRFPIADLKNMVVNLPWYKERLMGSLVKAMEDMNKGQWGTVTPPPDPNQTLVMASKTTSEETTETEVATDQ
ncbi:hypothetical protein BABINDRAFT_89047 [Babjeviella inositovora NRRL Y-12698]|uniref:Uncharacterized protein n=1 Tax=Babjeviella inositovora NRRL Y-12698 TaxID=984486 RepID=A0A1E3QLA0_9ASCO|nr:uncharacterized protein BABINDRAFT_89047 [Babjeviella inositovora NRRL Y-12698]ODQ78244.1 hypothetical protein BABINDRAFT_89047 [Babjeviella inositovora NRRL Y-12698]